MDSGKSIEAGPLVICITGGIGSGKSVVSRILRSRGETVYDCDHEAKRLMEESETLKEKIAERLGACCITDSGKIDRKAVASKVFTNSNALSWLNAQVHGMVREDLENFKKMHRGDKLFLETAIPNSSGLTAWCDEVWLISAPEEVRIERVAKRNGANIKEIRQRIEAQNGEYENISDKKIRRIINDGLHPILPQIL